MKMTWWASLILSTTLIGCASKIKHLPDDSYLWLEGIEEPPALSWVKAQNEKTLQKIEKDPHYQAYYDAAHAILVAPDRVPTGPLIQGYIYNFWQDQKSVRGIWRRTKIADYRHDKINWEVLLDLDEVAKKEEQNWVWKGAHHLPSDPRHVMIRLARGGSDASVEREYDIEKKAWVSDGFNLPEAKSHVAWLDRDHLLVASDFGPTTLSLSGYPLEMRLWQRGKPIVLAKTIHHGEAQDLTVHAETYYSQGKTYAFLFREIAFFENEKFLLGLDGDKIPVPLPRDAEMHGLFKGYIIAQARRDALVNGTQVMAGDLFGLRVDALTSPAEIIFRPDAAHAIVSVEPTHERLVVTTLNNVKGELLAFDHQAKQWSSQKILAPEGGTISVFSASDREEEILFSYSSFLTPPTVFLSRLGSKTITTTQIKQAPQRFNGKGYKTEQMFAKSADGTPIPYFVVYAEGTKFDGTAPTLLGAYGGFELANTPQYLSTYGKTWLEMTKGIYVLANIRGGGEFGPNWHLQAIKENRQKVFDDFIAVAEDLERRQITSPKKLAIEGGSNGGLLVSGTFVQRPDLYRAVVCKVPLADMLRYHKLLAGHSWEAEYGDPEDPKMREIIAKYSPFQNLKAGEKYPQTLFMTSTRDDRVHPGHARKMVARMNDLGYEPMYFENIEGGHGGAANLEQRARLQAIEFTFLYQELVGAPRPAAN